MAAVDTVYKLMVLYMLERQKSDLSGTQITDFFLERGYTDYFTVQSTISDLLSSDLLSAEATRTSTRYAITPAGKETIRLFEGKLTEEVKKDIENFLLENGTLIREENAFLSDYDRTLEGSYAVHLQYKEKGRKKIDLTLSLPSREAAEAACLNWKTATSDVYAFLMDLLIR